MAELPRLGVIQTQYGTTKLQVLAIGIQQTLAVVKQYAKSNAALFLRDASGGTYGTYYLSGYIPLNYVIKPDGKVYNRTEGFNESTIKSWIDACVVGVEENNPVKVEIPELVFSPNPFRVATAISLKGMETAHLQIVDLSGRMVKHFSLNSNSKVTWDRTDDNGKLLPAGMYFCKFHSGPFFKTQKITILE